MSHPSIALALGGGGARGLAHVGAIEVLNAAGIIPSRIVGVSVGSVVAAAYAVEPDITAVREHALNYLLSPAFQRYSMNVNETSGHVDGVTEPIETVASWFTRFRDYIRANRAFHRMILGTSLLPGHILEEVVNHLVPDIDVSESRIPLTIVAVDLVTGREVEITKGPLRRAVLGSASLPGIFPPVEYGSCLLADIGVISAVPCHAARRSGADRVIAIDVTQHPTYRKNFSSAIDVLLRLEDVASSLFLNLVLQQADAVIRPAVWHLDWTDFSTVKETIEAGRTAAKAALPNICAVLGIPMLETASDAAPPVQLGSDLTKSA